jgi:hypothetical protein
MDRKVIDDYEKALDKLRKSVAGLSREHFLAVPVPGTWSIQQIVVHIMDSDLIWTDRAKRVIAEENPTLIGYDESRFAENLHCEEYSIDDAITIFELNRKNFAKVLRRLPDAAFDRMGGAPRRRDPQHHPPRGPSHEIHTRKTGEAGEAGVGEEVVSCQLSVVSCQLLVVSC